MAEEGAAPPPGGDYSGESFSKILLDVTGKTADLPALVDQGSGTGQNSKGWLSLSDVLTETGGGTEGSNDGGSTSSAAYTYTAYEGVVWIGIDADWELTRKWNDTIDDMDALMLDLLTGQFGRIDISMLQDSKAVLDQYVSWLDEANGILQQWVGKLTSDDSKFKGKAANVLKQHVDNFQFIVSDLREQIVEDLGTPSRLQELATALRAFTWSMAFAWFETSGKLKNVPGTIIGNIVSNVAEYVRQMGLASGEPNYVLDLLNAHEVNKWDYAFKDGISADAGKRHIRAVVAGYSSTHSEGLRIENIDWVDSIGELFNDHAVTFDLTTEYYSPVPIVPSYEPPDNYKVSQGAPPPTDTFPEIRGPLNSADTWLKANRYINDYLNNRLEPLNEAAREALNNLEESYVSAKPSLRELDQPTPLEPSGGGGGGLGGGPGGNDDINETLEELFSGGGPGGNDDINETLEELFGGGGSGDGSGGGNSDINDQLNELFGGGGSGDGSGGGNSDINDQLNQLLGGGPVGGPLGGGSGGVGNFKSPTNSNGKPTQLFDANGNPIPMGPDGSMQLPLDEDGNPLPVFDANGNPVSPEQIGGSTPLFDANGNPIPVGPDGGMQLPLDANGNPLPVFDADGNLVSPANGTPLFDANGNPIPVGPDGGMQLPLDEDGNPLPVFDANGNPVSPEQFVGDVSSSNGGSDIPDLSDLYDDSGDFPVGGRDEEAIKDLLNGNSNGSSDIPDISELAGGNNGAPGGTTNIPDDIASMLNGGGNGPGTATANGSSDFPVGGGGDGLGSGGGPGNGLGTGTSGFRGEGWSSWSGQDQGQGGPGSKSGGGLGGGGRPFMPPMMPPIMPPQGSQGNKDRERQTWLSEDEEVWGTKGSATAGVIGLPDGPEVENEEQRAPTHVHLRSTAPSSERQDDTRGRSTQESSEGSR